MKFYDSYSEKIIEYKDERGDKTLRLYVCGLTPYDDAHVGHARTYVFFDILKRYFLYKGYKVIHVQNVTDVEDKIIKRSKEKGVNPIELAKEYHEKALELFDKLNILRADYYPKVSEHIEDIINLIKKIRDNGHAYIRKSGVYFDVNSFPDYGKLSKRTFEHIESRLAENQDKKDTRDFALWKCEDDIISFESPFCKGRPGWHIECSAMSMKYLGETLDIHGGAQDLKFPHHENEIAQSESATGKKFSRYWIHTGFLTVNGEKMSKSLGNFTTIKEALEKHSPMALRMFFLMSHYRSPIDYSDEKINDAEKALKSIFRFLDSLDEKELVEEKQGDAEEYIERIIEAIDNDFDTPRAIATMFELIREYNKKEKISKQEIDSIKQGIKDILYIFGIKREENRDKRLEKVLEKIIELRDEYKKNKQYEISDKIREKLREAGIILEDKNGKTIWRAE